VSGACGRGQRRAGLPGGVGGLALFAVLCPHRDAYGAQSERGLRRPSGCIWQGKAMLARRWTHWGDLLSTVLV